MEGVKQGLELLSTILDAAPIPGSFKSVVRGIPDIALQILKIVEVTVKGNVEDAKALAVYIANVIKTTMRPLETPGSLDSSSAMKTRIEEFQGVFTYSKDASKLAVTKKTVDDAINLIQTAVATGHEVDLISQAQQRNDEEYRLMLRRLEVNTSALIGPQTMLTTNHL
ncbi:hypothetical protein FRB97_002209 [Tulasnella sp. 331]|nr:hypothetical protein FRB97_002209 [Tulasnella sp. 331]